MIIDNFWSKDHTYVHTHTHNTHNTHTHRHTHTPFSEKAVNISLILLINMYTFTLGALYFVPPPPNMALNLASLNNPCNTMELIEMVGFMTYSSNSRLCYDLGIDL